MVHFQFSSIKCCHVQLVELKKKLLYLHKKTISLEVSSSLINIYGVCEYIDNIQSQKLYVVRIMYLLSVDIT